MGGRRRRRKMDSRSGRGKWIRAPGVHRAGQELFSTQWSMCASSSVRARERDMRCPRCFRRYSATNTNTTGYNDTFLNPYGFPRTLTSNIVFMLPSSPRGAGGRVVPLGCRECVEEHRRGVEVACGAAESTRDVDVVLRCSHATRSLTTGGADFFRRSKIDGG